MPHPAFLQAPLIQFPLLCLLDHVFRERVPRFLGTAIGAEFGPAAQQCLPRLLEGGRQVRLPPGSNLVPRAYFCSRCNIAYAPCTFWIGNCAPFMAKGEASRP